MGLSPLVHAQDLRAVWNGRELRVSAGHLNFLTGRSLDQLHNGRAVSYDFQLSVHRAGVPARRSIERFAISYDLWEERFRVTRIAREKLEHKTQSNLTQNAAQTWCVDNITLPTADLDPDTPVTVQLEVRAQEGKESTDSSNEPALSLASLIELFSRPARSQQQRWLQQAGPLRLTDIRAKAN